MLIVEYLHLLLTRSEGTPEGYGTQRGYGETAALITDLLVAERVVLSADRKPRVEVVSAAPTGHMVLDHALPLLVERSGRKLESLITWRKLDPSRVVAESLILQGVLARGERTMLGLGEIRTPELNPEPEQMVRQQLAAVLAGQVPAGIVETTLLAVLQGLGVAHKVLRVESGGLRAGQLKKRIDAVVQESPAGTAVERAVQAMAAAVATGAMVAVMAGGSGS